MNEQESAINALTDDVGPQEPEFKRRPYEPPRLESGDIFERIIMDSNCGPGTETCSNPCV